MKDKICIECKINPQLNNRRICKSCYNKIKQKSLPKGVCFMCEKEIILKRKNQHYCYDCGIEYSKYRCKNDNPRKIKNNQNNTKISQNISNSVKNDQKKNKYNKNKALEILNFNITYNNNFNTNHLSFWDYNSNNPNCENNTNELINRENLDKFYFDNIKIPPGIQKNSLTPNFSEKNVDF